MECFMMQKFNIPYSVPLCISDIMLTTFFYFESFLKKFWTNNAVPKLKAISNIKHVYIQPFTTVAD